MSKIRTATEVLPTHCAPVNRNAVRETWAPQAEQFSTFEKPKLCQISIEEIRRRHTLQRYREKKWPYKSNFRDLTGLRRGAVTVIGLLEYRENGKSRWCVQCDCGRYEPRSHYAWWKFYRLGHPDYCCKCSPTSLQDQVMQLSSYRSDDRSADKCVKGGL